MSTVSHTNRRYELLEVLGQGGFGEVLRARLLGPGGFSKQVALKILRTEPEGSTELVARLRDEARMLGLLRHRAVVRVDGLVRLEGSWAVVMEYVDGASGAELRDAAHVPVAVALALIEEVASALSEAWNLKVGGRQLRLLHRDIKPANIRLTADGTVKLLDFGIARADFRNREASTHATLYGSVPFMAPERLALRATDRSDVFSLGITLVELLAGPQHTQPSSHPEHHAERVETLLGALQRHVADDGLLDLVRRCLALEPSERPDAATLAREARELRRGLEDVYLPDWSRETVPALITRRPRQDDPRLGQVWIEEGLGPAKGKAGVGNTFVLTDSLELPAPALDGVAVSGDAESAAAQPMLAMLGVGGIFALGLGCGTLTAAILVGLLASAWLTL